MGVYSLQTALSDVFTWTRLADLRMPVSVSKFDGRKITVVLDGHDKQMRLRASKMAASCKVSMVVLDVEYAIGDCCDLKTGLLDEKKLYAKYVAPFLKDEVFVIAVVGGVEPTTLEMAKTTRQRLKLLKTVRKSMSNLSTIDQMKQMELYANEQAYALDIDMMEEDDAASDASLKRSQELFDRVAFAHWARNSSTRRIRRLTEQASEIFRKEGFPVVHPHNGEADELIVMLASWLQVPIVSGDSDMIAHRCMTIFDIDQDNGHVKVVDYAQFVSHFASEFRTSKDLMDEMIRPALALASADFNPIIYDIGLNFRSALKAILEADGDFLGVIRKICEVNGRFADEDLARQVMACYDMPEDCPAELIDILTAELNQTSAKTKMGWVARIGTALSRSLAGIHPEDLFIFAQIWAQTLHNKACRA